MTSIPIVSRFGRAWRALCASEPHCAPDLHTLWQHPELLPAWVQASPLARHYLELLGPLEWHAFPERDLTTQRGMPAVPFMPFVAACLVKLDQHLPYFSHLRHYLNEHPAVAWLLGFPCTLPTPIWQGGNANNETVSLPTQRHFPRLLRKIPNASLQWLLDQTVNLLRAELAEIAPDFGQTIALDTKHILAWVKENNPKAYVKERFVKEQPPTADPDCRLGCKRKHNQHTASSATPATPDADPVPADTLAVGEYYWGYASGIVTTKVPGWGEFVLAELTQPFNRPDVAYFFSLLAATERRLGFRPHFGAFDAAYDAFYIYEYFHQDAQPWQTAFAAVPLAQRTSHDQFDADGLPLCPAGLSMPLKNTFMHQSGFFPHECGRYVCPLLYPQPSGVTCPSHDKHWEKGGCTVTIPTSIGARLRHWIDRNSPLYKTVYQQRTATERLFSLAKALGMERPKLRNGRAIANLNTLIYILLNLRALRRIKQRKAAQNRAQ